MGSKAKSIFASLGYLLLGFGIQIVVTIVGMIGLAVFYAISNADILEGNTDAVMSNMDSMMNYVVGATSWILLFSSIITVLALILIYKIKKRKVMEELQFKNTNIVNYLSAVLLGGLCWLFNSSLLTLISNAGLLEEQFINMENILSPLTAGSIVVSIITIGIIAPIAEEFLFRGVVFNTLRKRFSPAWTIGLQGVFFGIYHMNLIQGTYATLLGVIFGYVTYKTRSIWPAIIMHIVNNSMSFILNAILVDYVPSTTTYIIQGIIAAVGIIGVLFLIYKKNYKLDEEIPGDIQY
ncbi:CPBP family intramembrane metalloprotease [Clostridium tertium]|uniref:CAAX amino terminal protease self- immunity n=1 Tax=Clostridium tertium TaxID=1559 RepID=A0A6N3FDK1_9CLOT